jgi:hypothetical protein
VKKQIIAVLCIVLVALLSLPVIADAKADKKSAKGANAKSRFTQGDGVGVSYQIAILQHGLPKNVDTAHTFSSGDRLKMYMSANTSGYLTVINIGPTGSKHLLFNDFVDARETYMVPKKGSMVMTGKPGTEKLIIMLSKAPNQVAASMQQGSQKAEAAQQQAPAAQKQAEQPAAQQQAPAAEAPASDPETPLPSLLASLNGAKDIVLEDELGTSYGVMSPKDYKISNNSASQISVESAGGTNYGVITPALFEQGEVLTLEVKLKHK